MLVVTTIQTAQGTVELVAAAQLVVAAVAAVAVAVG